MAYMSKELKKQLVEKAKPILKEYGIKGTFSVDNYSGIRLTISEGRIDFLENYNNSKPRWADPMKKDREFSGVEHLCDRFSGVAHDFLIKMRDCLNDGNHDRSDIMTDYFDVGWYVWINLGKWDKPYKFLGV